MDQYALNAIKAWNTRQRPDYQLIKVTQVNPSIGAEIEGIDLTQPLTAAQFAEIKTAAVNNKHVRCQLFKILFVSW